MTDEQYIHIRNWDRFQHPDTTRSTAAALPWIKSYTSQLVDEDYMDLSWSDRGLLESLRLQYAANRGRGINQLTTNLQRLFGQRVLSVQLKRLNDAGFIEFSASKTLATRKQPASLEVEGDKNPPTPRRRGERMQAEPKIHTCPKCRLPFKAKTLLDEHVYTSHDGPEPAHWQALEENPPVAEPTPVDDLELPPPEERHRIASEVRAQLLGVAAAARSAADNGAPPPLEFFLDTEPPEDE